MGNVAGFLSLLLLSVACTSHTPPVTASEQEPEPRAAQPKEPVSSAIQNVDPVEAEPPQTPERTKTLFVHEARVDCEGERPMKCLQVRENEQDEWTYFYDVIVGFDYEESYRYELRVEVEEIRRPPLDTTTERYRLMEVVAKEPAQESADE